MEKLVLSAHDHFQVKPQAENSSVRRGVTFRSRTACPGRLCALALLAIAFFLNPNLASLSEFNRAKVADGQAWRIVSCHWTHYSASHLFWDLLMFVALGAIGESRNRSSMLTVTAVTAILIPAAIWYVLPDLVAYRGLSGIDSALFMLAAAGMSRGECCPRPRMTFAVNLVVVLFLAKIAVECARVRRCSLTAWPPGLSRCRSRMWLGPAWA